jgi:hypothetical protein
LKDPPCSGIVLINLPYYRFLILSARFIFIRPQNSSLSSYASGKIKLFNVLPYISGTWHEELNNYNYFKTVHIILNGNGIERDHEQKIAPYEL